MGGTNFRSAILIGLSFAMVVALFHGVVFPIVWNHLESLREQNSNRGLGFALTGSQRHQWQVVFWLAYAAMLAVAGTLPMLIGWLRGARVQAIAAFVVPASVLLGLLSLPILIFVGGCSDLFSGVSC